MAAQTSGKTIFVVVDLPRDGPFKTWQKFKDFARTALNMNGHQPGWTEMKSQADGSAVGFTICKTSEDAKLIYDHLVALTRQDCYANVHWYDTSYSKHWPVACNCPTEQHRANYDYYRHHVHFLAHFQAQYMASTNSLAYAAPAAVYMAHLPDAVQALTANLQTLAMGHTYYSPAAPAPSPYYPVQPPVVKHYSLSYATNSQGYPVNASNGLVRSEHNVVILKNLDADVTEDELQAVLGKTASPVTLDIRRSFDSKKRTTSAIATFRNYKEAKRVLEHFRRREIHIRKKAIRAEIGKDSTPRSAVQPTVVNGST